MASNWLRCIQTFLGLALIQNSVALRCHTCSQLMAACEIAECAPVQDILEKLGVTPASGSGPVIDDADQTCISIEETDSTGKDLMRGCIPSGKRWISLVGGQDGCKEVDKTKLVDVQKQDTDETLEWAKEKFNNSQQLTSPASGFNLDKVLETIAELRQKAQEQILESSSGNMFRVCACQKELCNGDGIDPTTTTKRSSSGVTSGFMEVRNGAIIIIILGAVACLVNGF